MPTPRLEIDGEFYRLKETGKATYVPETPSTFLNNNGASARPPSRLAVCVSMRNREATIGADLDKLVASLEPADLKLIMADNGSTDGTIEMARKWAERTRLDYLFFEFEYEANAGRAAGRLSAMAKIMVPDFHICIVAIEALERPHRIGSFCLVATEEVATEAALLIRSLRTFHTDPIFVLCDKPTRHLIERQGDADVEFKQGASKTTLAKLDKRFREHVSIGNDFHRVDCIAAKMDALDWALAEAGDSLFLDADIVALANLNEGFAHELMLGPHYHGNNPFEACRKFGVINAGYLWTNNQAVPEAWREIYLGRSAFFEQEGMPVLLEKFDAGFFPPTHNVGFWREPRFPAAGIKSWHVHMSDSLDEKANEGLRGKYIEHRHRVVDELERVGRFDLLAHLKEVTA